MGKLSRRNFLKTSALAGVGLSLGIKGEASSKITAKNSFDTIIKNGTIYTGDDKAPITGDIGISGDRIAAIGKLGDSADLIIDASGKAVSPGFIDLHTHSDNGLLDCPLADARLYQGVTTDIGGNCGESPFPYSDEYFASKKGTLRNGFPFWQDIDGFYDAMRKKKIAVNYKTYTGQGDLRNAVIGSNDVKATNSDIEKMKAILDEEMHKGSLGLSCGLEYAPGAYASDEELIELCKVVAKHDGLFAIHMRNESDTVEESLAESINIARKSGVRIEISHLKAQNANNWHKAPNLLRMIEDAHRSGIDIAFDRYPYTAFSTGLSSFIPLSDRQGSTDEIVARLRDEKLSKEIGKYAESRMERLGGPKNVMITSVVLPENKVYLGKNVEECCKISGLEPWPFIRKILADEKIRTQMVGFAMTEENVKMILSHPLAMPISDSSLYSPYGSLSQSNPHPRAYGSFPRFVGKYCRDENLMSLSEAVYKCTALPASRLKLKERGTLTPNYFADVLVFDPNTIIDKATYSDPHQYCHGIEHVFVNGALTLSNGKHTGKYAGMIV